MNCPVCLSAVIARSVLRGTDLAFETTERVFSLSRCCDCRCLFLDPLPDSPDIAAFYPQQYWPRSGAGMLARLEKVYRRVVLRDHSSFVMRSMRHRMGGATVRLLDVGCGTGLFLSEMKRRGFNVEGFDASAEAAKIAKLENGVKVHVGERLEDAMYPPESFDCVTLFHVLEHVSSPRVMLREVRRILKPEGRVIVQVPNIDSWQFKLFGPRWYGLDVPRHVIDYSQQSILRLLTDAGFKAHEVRHFNFRDNAPAFASSLVPRLDPLRRGARRSAGNREASLASWIGHAAYLGLVICAYPPALIEAWAGAGATIMIEAADER